MQPKTRSQALISLAAKLLKSWATEDALKFPGVRFDNEEPRWRGGYGIARDHDVPDFVKKDNDGWDYVAQSKDE